MYVFKDGIVDPTDLIMIDNDGSSFESGYVATDVTGDGFVDSSDLLVTGNNAMNFNSLIAH